MSSMLNYQLAEPTSVTETELILCQNRSISHTWKEKENQIWIEGYPVTFKGQRIGRTAWCIGTCTRCGSQRVEIFAIDNRARLLSKVSQRYRYTRAFKARTVVEVAHARWLDWRVAMGYEGDKIKPAKKA